MAKLKEPTISTLQYMCSFRSLLKIVTGRGN